MFPNALVFIVIVVLAVGFALRRHLIPLADRARAHMPGRTDGVSFNQAVRAAVRAGTHHLDGARDHKGEYVAPSSPLVFELRSDVWEAAIAPVRTEATAAVADGIAELTGIDVGDLAVRLCSAPLAGEPGGPVVTLVTVAAGDGGIGGTVCPAPPSAPTGPTRFRVRTEGSGNTVSRLPEGRPVGVGRAPGNAIRLTDRAVSAHHLTLVAAPDHVRLTDLGTTNGTKVNGRPVTGVVLLHHGDTIALGEHARWVIFDTDHASLPPVSVLDPDLAPLDDEQPRAGADLGAPRDIDDRDVVASASTPVGGPRPMRPRLVVDEVPVAEVAADVLADGHGEAAHRPVPVRPIVSSAELRTEPMRWSDRPARAVHEDAPVVAGTDAAGAPVVLRALSGDLGEIGNGHVLVVGTSGAGKTQLTRSVVGQALGRGVTALAIDPAGEYGDIGLRSVNLWRDGVAASPMVPVSGTDVDRTAFELVDAMATGVASYGGGARLGHRQSEALRLALLATYDSVGPSRWPVLQDVHGHLTPDLKGVLAPITDRPVFGAGGPLGDILGEDVSLDLSDFPGTTGASRLAVGLTLASVALRAATLPPAIGDLRHLVVIDEAHRAKGFGAVPSLLREGRRAGVGVILVSQALDDLPEIATAVAATTIVFRLGPKAAEQAAAHLGDPTLAPRIAQLAPGRCFVHQAGSPAVLVDATRLHGAVRDDVEVAG